MEIHLFFRSTLIDKDVVVCYIFTHHKNQVELTLMR